MYIQSGEWVIISRGKVRFKLKDKIIKNLRFRIILVIFLSLIHILKKGVSAGEVASVYEHYYGKETFIRVLEEGACPETKWVEGSNYVDIGFQIDKRTGRIIMMGAIDNLVKGAAGQAVQNMNLLFGIEEKEGLDLVPMFP